MSDADKWKINYSWSQPYDAYNTFYYMNRAVETQQELDRLEMIDRWVDSMLTYPDAEVIMNKIRQGDKHD